MTKSLSSFRATVLLGWIALCVAGFLYARVRGIPNWAALPALAAFLVEFPFYLVPAFPAVRERVAGPRLPLFLVLSAALPYLACCCGAVPFHWTALAQLVALALAFGLWYAVLPATPWSDLGFLGLFAMVMLGKFFNPIYPKPFDHVEVSFLGKVAVLQIVVLTLMLARRVPETGYGFLPTRNDWRIGVRHFLYFLPIGFPLGLALKAVQISTPAPIWVDVGTFLGILWVVALAEEFVLRGVLQRWMEDWTRSRAAALVIVSAVFGAAHLWFRGFPNWRFAVVAAVAGWFYGRARNQAGSIRAGMVTHALVVTALKGFFK